MFRVICTQASNQPTNQPVNQPTNQPVNQPTNQPTNFTHNKNATHVLQNCRYGVFFGPYDSRNIVTVGIPGTQSNKRAHLASLLTAFQICSSWPHKVLINCCSKLSVRVTYAWKLIHDYLCTHQRTHTHRSMGYNSLLDSKLSDENPTANRWRMLTCGSNWHSGATGASTSVSSICHNVQWNAMHV